MVAKYCWEVSLSGLFSVAQVLATSDNSLTSSLVTAAVKILTSKLWLTFFIFLFSKTKNIIAFPTFCVLLYSYMC